jgi:BASS family bile acid:Na+ symporter
VITEVLLPVCIAGIMVVLGLSLTPDDFRRVVAIPRGVAIGLANLLVVSPLLAFGVAELTGLSPELAVGLVLLGASPGGAMANLLTHLAKGEVALSVTMTAISSLMALITVPLYLGLAIDHFGAGFDDDFGMAGIVVRVFLITVVPLSIGMTVRHLRESWVEANYEKARRLSLVLFVLVVVAAVASEADLIFDNIGRVAVAALLLNVAAMAIGFGVSRMARLNTRQATAIAMELGVHNSTVAIAVAAVIDTELAIPAAVYSMFMFITAGSFARFIAGRNALPAATVAH